jgi:uncharacterized protein
MLERDGYMPGVPCWIDTAQPDPDAATQFYGDLFGWAFEDRMPPGSGGQYHMATLQGREVAAISSQPPGSPPTPAWNTYIWVDSTDDTAAKVRDAGGSVLMEPFDVLDAGRMSVCADPSGAGFSLWQPNQHRGAQAVNQPGTWNWSNLNTRDLEGAKAFYGAVFGWQVHPMDMGDFHALMLCVPGYGDFLEGQYPGVKKRHADMGAPESFTDSIGWVNPMTSDEFADDVPSHWSITFAVEDVDAVVDATTQRGGKVLTPASDVAVPNVGGIRTAVLSDPQSAVFAVNAFVPG